MICPDCQAEYLDNINECGDCKVNLIDACSLDLPIPEMTWIPLPTLIGSTYADMIIEILNQKKIPHYVKSNWSSSVLSTRGSELIDDVIFGCVDQVGAQSGNVARNAILASSLPESVPGTSVDRQCGSSQQAIHFAIQAVMSGTQDIVIGGGVEVMSMVPIGASIKDGYEAGHGLPFDSDGMKERYPGIFFSQFTGAELMADKWNLSREDLDKFALSSHQKAAAAVEGKYFDREILPVQAKNAEGKTDMVLNDEGIRYDASLEALSGLNPVTEGGVITAGNASQLSDGASS